MYTKKLPVILLLFLSFQLHAQERLLLNEQNYFEMHGLNVTFFSDFYPEGHQSGVTIIQHGNRVAANGDLRLEASPGQWSPIPDGEDVVVKKDRQMLSKTLWYPDTSKDARGFNPIFYPDLNFIYHVHVQALEGNRFKIMVDLEEPLPEEWIGRVGFNLELFPGNLFGKSFIMDKKHGLFPIQPVGPVIEKNGEFLTKPMATGEKLIVAPGEDLQRMTITTKGKELQLWDGRANHNNGWYIVRSEVPAGATESAIEWIIEPNVDMSWKYEPVIQVSQLGYHPKQEKLAIIETGEKLTGNYKLFRLGENGKDLVKEGKGEVWGKFLRYQYQTINFSDITQSGMYQISYEEKLSHPFKISEDVYRRYTWQPTLEYYLPVQMCHMRVNEKYRVWHDLCHMDDALMAPVNHNHFDGYKQGPETLTEYKSGEHVPGLNKGGWHDAGDYDLRVESQIRTIWLLAAMIEEFDLHHDATFIDQEKNLVEIHMPDGKNDVLQQIEHGLETVLGGYRSLGRLYRGIIASDLRQYVMLGDATSMTDNVDEPFDGKVKGRFGEKDDSDDRWVFTEKNPSRELQVAAGLTAASRVLQESNPSLSQECHMTALELFSGAYDQSGHLPSKVFALTELMISLPDNKELYGKLYGMKEEIISDIDDCGWMVGRVIHLVDNDAFKKDMEKAVATYQERLQEEQKEDSPYGVPYKPRIWGAGWEIQRFGVDQYFFYKGWPEITSTRMFEHALNFILGVHPGSNNASFASGIGSESVTVAYGVNRADWSFIPGGVASGTALIRPDLPELKTWPFFWQQTEYVMGGGATNFMFLVLAVDWVYGGSGE